MCMYVLQKESFFYVYVCARVCMCMCVCVCVCLRVFLIRKKSKVNSRIKMRK